MWPYNYFGDFWDKLGSIPDLLQSTKPVRAANKTIIGVKGYFEAIITSQHASKQSKIYVMKADQVEPPLMLRDDLFDLGYLQIFHLVLIQLKISTRQKKNSKKQLRKFTKHNSVCFKESKYSFHTEDLKLKPGSEPFVLRAIPVPQHWHKPAKERLNEFVCLKILEPLSIGYAIEFCSPLLVVKKPNKDEPRLVVNYKKLNSMLSRTRHVPAVGLKGLYENHKWIQILVLTRLAPCIPSAAIKQICTTPDNNQHIQWLLPLALDAARFDLRR